ncbi:MAG: hypothetical protein PF442_07470 [Desulfobulbaceae bacterium]|jgi:hypothetical protein|nr:hypothetical protein [Desulfobulbaceae bacterium]
MAEKSFKNILRSWKSTYVLLRSEPEALLQFRQLILTCAICIFVAYGINKAVVAPRAEKNAELASRLVEHNVAKNSQEVARLTSRLSALQQQMKKDQHELEILTLKERFIKEHWAGLGDNDKFNRLIFTQMDSAPVNIEQNLLKTTQLEPRNKNGFSIYPMALEGTGDFQQVFQYLRFLESRPEVGFLDQVSLAAIPATDIKKPVEVEFKISIGRLELKHDS